MKVKIDIAESKLKNLVALIGNAKGRVAVAKGAKELRIRSKAMEFGRKLREGVFDYGLTNEEIEACDR